MKSNSDLQSSETLRSFLLKVQKRRIEHDLDETLFGVSVGSLTFIESLWVETLMLAEAGRLLKRLNSLPDVPRKFSLLRRLDVWICNPEFEPTVRDLCNKQAVKLKENLQALHESLLAASSMEVRDQYQWKLKVEPQLAKILEGLTKIICNLEIASQKSPPPSGSGEPDSVPHTSSNK